MSKTEFLELEYEEKELEVQNRNIPKLANYNKPLPRQPLPQKLYKRVDNPWYITLYIYIQKHTKHKNIQMKGSPNE